MCSAPTLVAGAVLAAAITVASTGIAQAAAAKVDLTTASSYLATTTAASGTAGGTSLAHDGYYELFSGFADFGGTIDGAFALEASGKQSATLKKVVGFIADKGTDGMGRDIDDYTGIGTKNPSGGAIGKEAVLAESAGRDPRSFEGHDLIAALDAAVCAKAGSRRGCAGKGAYRGAQSTFSQAFGVIAQLRAKDAARAASSTAYLQAQQNPDGSFSAALPGDGSDDVDSTAMAAMALRLVGDAAANAEVTHAEQWLAGQQAADGSYAGSAAGSTNSTALAIQGLALAGTKKFAAQIAAAQSFLARQQQPDGGVDVSKDDGQGSDVRATTQVVVGVTTRSYGTLARQVAA